MRIALFLLVLSLSAVAAEPKVFTSRSGEYSIVIVRDAGRDPFANDGATRAVHLYRYMKSLIYSDRGTIGDNVTDNPLEGFDGRMGLVFIVHNRDPKKGFAGIHSLTISEIQLGLAVFYQADHRRLLPLESRLTGHPPHQSIPELLEQWERKNPELAEPGTHAEAGWFAKRKDAPEILMPFLLRAVDEHLLDERASVGNLYLQTNPNGLAPYYKRRMGFRQVFLVIEDPHIKDGRGVSIMHLSRKEVKGVSQRILSSMGLPAVEAFTRHPLSDLVEEPPVKSCPWDRF